MKLATSVNDPEITAILRAGGIGVLRTDTLYGLVALASDENAVKRVYTLKGRDDAKSPIVLVNNLAQLYDRPNSKILSYLENIWPGKVSVILPSTNAPLWIRRNNDSVAYRMPDSNDLLDLLDSVGPLIAPSANPEGLAPAMNIEEASAYFSDNVNFYVDGGQVIDDTPSRLVLAKDNGEMTRLR